MEDFGASQVSPPLSKPKRRRWFLCLAIAAALAIVAVVLFSVVTDFGNTEKTIWYTPAQFAKALNPGPLTKAKLTVLRWLDPLLRHFQKPKAAIMLESRVFKMPPTEAGDSELGIPASTNIDGMRLWILPPEKMQALTQRVDSILDRKTGVSITFPKQLNGLPQVSRTNLNANTMSLSAPRILTADGMHSKASSSLSSSIAGQSMTTSLTMEFIPKIKSDSIRLLLCVTSTDAPSSGPGSAQPGVTNLFAACRVLVPNQGVVVIDGGSCNKTNFDHWWIILSPSQVDPTGKKIAIPVKSAK